MRSGAVLKFGEGKADIGVVEGIGPFAKRQGNGLQIRHPRFKSGRGLSRFKSRGPRGRYKRRYVGPFAKR